MLILILRLPDGTVVSSSIVADYYVLLFFKGDTSPPDDISEWYLCQGKGKTKLHDFVDIPSDIYVIGTQVY